MKSKNIEEVMQKCLACDAMLDHILNEANFNIECEFGENESALEKHEIIAVMKGLAENTDFSEYT